MTGQELYRLLLVEDNELDARAMTRALQGQGDYEVMRAHDLAAGLDALVEEAFDCVLLDLSLPDSAGLVSVETVVARSPHCPVVVLTGLDDPNTALEAVERGAQDYLVKNTITPELVVRAIRYAVARHSSETELRGAQARLSDMRSREQIARDLHDTVIQRLFAVGMSLQAGVGGSREDLVNRAMTAVDEIDVGIRELRQAIFGLNAPEGHESLAQTLQAVAASFKDTLGFPPVVRLGELPDLDPDLRQDLVSVATEAISNAARHAGATTVTVSVFVEDDELILRVTDNGQTGAADFADGAESPVADELSGHGLRNMTARAEAHGGEMRFNSDPAAGGELVWTVPLPTH